MNRRYVLTGAPGCGKTTTLEALGQRGHAVVAEAATDVIAAQQVLGVDAPWELPGFVDRVVDLQRERRLIGPDAEVQFIDRSPLCSLALARYLRLAVSQATLHEVAAVVDGRLLERDVFLLRPLGFIEPTAARQISYQDSLKFEAVHEAVYREYGFTLVDVAPVDVESRVHAIESHVQHRGPSNRMRTGRVVGGDPSVAQKSGLVDPSFGA